MTAFLCFAKAVAMTLVAFVALFAVSRVLLFLDLPILVVWLTLLGGLAVVGHKIAADLLESENPGLWAAALFVFGLIAFLILWYRYERLLEDGRPVAIPASAYRRPLPDRSSVFAPLGDQETGYRTR